MGENTTIQKQTSPRHDPVAMRVLEVTLALLTIPLWGSITLLLALLVRLFNGSPAFFRQERAGLHGQPFTIIKLRTMRTGTEPDSLRLTRLGRLLRRTSIDELPQLWLVIKGDMSLVGPRPLHTRYLPLYTPAQARRHECRPGLTGWAQVNGRNAQTWEERFNLDLWYVDHRSLWLDLRIIFRTVATIFSSRGLSAPGTDTMTEFTGTAPTPQDTTTK